MKGVAEFADKLAEYLAEIGVPPASVAELVSSDAAMMVDAIHQGVLSPPPKLRVVARQERLMLDIDPVTQAVREARTVEVLARRVK